MEENYTNIKERCLLFAKNQGLSIEFFLNSIDMTYGSFKGKAKKGSLNSDAIAKIYTKYTSINPIWLLTGEGEMLKESKPKDLIQPFNGSIPKGAKPFYNTPVSAGSTLAEAIKDIKPDGYLQGLVLPGIEMTENIFPVFGNSMVPEVLEHALIGVKKLENWEKIRTDKKYVIITIEERMTKYLELDEKDSEFIWCISTNYPRFKVFKEDILEIHQVTFVMNPS